jgi:hypothetical protein
MVQCKQLASANTAPVVFLHLGGRSLLPEALHGGEWDGLIVVLHDEVQRLEPMGGTLIY